MIYKSKNHIFNNQKEKQKVIDFDIRQEKCYLYRQKLWSMCHNQNLRTKMIASNIYKNKILVENYAYVMMITDAQIYDDGI